MTSKIIRDGIAGITKPAIVRMCRRAGILRINSEIYETIRTCLKVFLELTLRNCIIFMEHDRRKTIQKIDLEMWLKSNGTYLGASTDPNTFIVQKRCETYRSTRTKNSGPQNPNGSHIGGIIRPSHRFKAGTVAAREIRFQQKHSDSFAIPKTNFLRLCREIAHDYLEDVRFSKNFAELLQLVTENYLIKVLNLTNLCALHADRKTVQSKDIDLVLQMIKFRG